MKWESELRRFFEKDYNRRYSLPVLINLTKQYNYGPFRELRKNPKGSTSEVFELCQQLVRNEVAKERYTASIVPAAISPEMARNFYLSGEKTPSEEEIYEFLYLWLTGLHRGPFIVNLTGLQLKAMDDFRSRLIEEGHVILVGESRRGQEPFGISWSKLTSTLFRTGKTILPRASEFVFAFLILSYFASWLRHNINQDDELVKLLREMTLTDLLRKKFEITDGTALVIAILGRQKKRIYYISGMASFFAKWYSQYLLGKEEYPSICQFVSSLYVADKPYRDLSEDLLNKFLYYFLSGRVSGELLDKILNLKVSHAERTERPFGVAAATSFLTKLPS